MQDTVLIVPGFHGSGPAHWQSWFEQALPNTQRVRGIDWEAPVLARWASAVRREIDLARGTVWLVAHSFGCLASIVAASDRANKVGGMLLVAPADPERFSPLGLRLPGEPSRTVRRALPQGPLLMPSLFVASRDDPWMRFGTAQSLADAWGCHLVDAGEAGHINADAGYGPWPRGLQLLATLRAAAGSQPLGTVSSESRRCGRDSALARVRQLTRTEEFGAKVESGQ